MARQPADCLATPTSTQTDIASARRTTIAREVTRERKPEESASAQELP
jgi:hypothetical protein